MQCGYRIKIIFPHPQKNIQYHFQIFRLLPDNHNQEASKLIKEIIQVETKLYPKLGHKLLNNPCRTRS